MGSTAAAAAAAAAAIVYIAARSPDVGLSRQGHSSTRAPIHFMPGHGDFAEFNASARPTRFFLVFMCINALDPSHSFYELKQHLTVFVPTQIDLLFDCQFIQFTFMYMFNSPFFYETVIIP